MALQPSENLLATPDQPPCSARALRRSARGVLVLGSRCASLAFSTVDLVSIDTRNLREHLRSHQSARIDPPEAPTVAPPATHNLSYQRARPPLRLSACHLHSRLGLDPSRPDPRIINGSTQLGAEQRAPNLEHGSVTPSQPGILVSSVRTVELNISLAVMTAG